MPEVTYAAELPPQRQSRHRLLRLRKLSARLPKMRRSACRNYRSGRRRAPAQRMRRSAQGRFLADCRLAAHLPKLFRPTAKAVDDHCNLGGGNMRHITKLEPACGSGQYVEAYR